MNYRTTQKHLDILRPHFNIENISISTENTDWRGKKYQSDMVTIVDNIGFEVFDSSIIVFFFTDHVHFDDYGIELQEGQVDYIKRAEEFFVNLFTLPIKRKYTKRGNRVTRDQYFFIFSNGNEESIAGITFNPSLFRMFIKKEKFEENLRFSKEKQRFIEIIK